MAPTNQNHELPTIERDTAGVCFRPMRRVAAVWLKMFHCSFSSGDEAAARGMARLAR
ncbi:hypothetical protein D3C77_758070 [compost metagenome]